MTLETVLLRELKAQLNERDWFEFSEVIKDAYTAVAQQMKFSSVREVSQEIKDRWRTSGELVSQHPNEFTLKQGFNRNGSAEVTLITLARPVRAQPCKYWKKGRCDNGSRCVFVHNPRERTKLLRNESSVGSASLRYAEDPAPTATVASRAAATGASRASAPAPTLATICAPASTPASAPAGGSGPPQTEHNARGGTFKVTPRNAKQIEYAEALKSSDHKGSVIICVGRVCRGPA